MKNVEVLDAQLCPTICNPLDCSLPDSSVHGILQAGILQCIVIPFPGDLPKPGMEPRPPTLWQTYYHLKHQGSPDDKYWTHY